VTLNTVTQAYIGATVSAGGNVSVNALDTFTAQMVGGSLGFGGTAGVGAANTTLGPTTTVEGLVGDSAHVTASGAIGLTVSASASDDLITIAAGAAAGGDAAVVGSAAVNVLDETTSAFIDQNATINSINGGISVTASNTTNVVGVAGSLQAAG